MILRKYKLGVNDEKEYIVEAYTAKEAREKVTELYLKDFPNTENIEIKKIWYRESYEQNRKRVLKFIEENQEHYRDYRNKYQKQYNEKNPEAHKELQKKYREKNKEKEAERKKRWYEKNKEKILEKQKEYRKNK